MRPDMNKDIKPYTLSILVQDIPGDRKSVV